MTNDEKKKKIKKMQWGKEFKAQNQAGLEWQTGESVALHAVSCSDTIFTSFPRSPLSA